MTPSITTFSEFWPYYLSQHRHPVCRMLHFVGTSLALSLYAWIFVTWPDWVMLWLLAPPVVGYGFAWVGHFFVEGNRPATFGHPFWSLLADFRLFATMLTGRLWTGDLAEQCAVAAD